MAEVVDVRATILNVPPCPVCRKHVVKVYNTYQCVSCRRVYSLVTREFEEYERNHSMPSKKRGTSVVALDTQGPKATQESYMDTQTDIDVAPATIETSSTFGTVKVDAEELADAGLDKPAAASKPKVTKERRSNGSLETLVKAVTDAYVQGQINTEGKPLTPYRIARLIDERFPNDIKTSTGAVTECLKRWRAYGFATFAEGEDTPMAFGGYTDEARANGLKALKARYREANKATKAEAKAAAKAEAEAPVVAGV